MIEIVKGIAQWIANDYHSHPVRFIIECMAWLISIGCALTMSLTVPNVPLIVLYPLWILGCALYSWAAITRRSFGMLANYLVLTTIDSIGLARLLIN